MAVGNDEREGQDLVEMVLRNEMVVAGAFFRKETDTKKQKPEVYLLVVRRKQQLCRSVYSNILLGHYCMSPSITVVPCTSLFKAKI